MKTSNISNTSKTQKAGPLVNVVLAAVLLLTALPIAVFGIVQIFPPISDASPKAETVDEAKAKRTSAAERRAQRREAREAKKALAKNARAENTMVTVDPGFGGFSPGFGPGADMSGFGPVGFGPGNDNEGMFPGAMNTFGFGPGADMNGFGPGFGPGADMGGFGPGFGGGFGVGFGGGFGA